MAKLWAKKERNKFYLPGEEIKVNRNFAFSGFDLEKDPLSACKNRMLLAVFGFILIYVIIAVRTLGICISGFSPDDGNGEKELPQLKIENPITRADVTDRNGTIIATSLPTANLFAHPRKVRDKEKVAAKLSEYIPDMLYEEILEQLEKNSNFIYIKRNLSLAQRYQIYALGIQGLGFEDVEKRVYPQKNLFSHILGKTNIDNIGISGLEKQLDGRLTSSDVPLQLTIDSGVQDTIREKLAAAVKKYNAAGASAILMDVNNGEIIAMISLPDALEKVWYTRQYYGTLPHNAKAIYQKYLGWYDANPVNLDPLPPSDAAKKLVEYLGSTELVLCKAKKDYAKGEYQWVAQITKELVFADPSNQKARNLCADALEQLGYQAESGAWRNAYLMGAAELRNGNLSGRARTANGLTNSMRAMTVSMLLDYIAILTDANAAQNDDLTLNLTVTDENEQFYVTRKNGVLLTYPGENRPDAQASVTCRRLQLFALMTGQQAGQVQISGDATVLKRLLAYASKFEKTFNVIEP